jgi:hypothetical protein
VGPDKERDFWLSDPELIPLRSDDGVPALRVRVGGRAALAAKKPGRRARKGLVGVLPFKRLFGELEGSAISRRGC